MNGSVNSDHAFVAGSVMLCDLAATVGVEGCVTSRAYHFRTSQRGCTSAVAVHDQRDDTNTITAVVKEILLESAEQHRQVALASGSPFTDLRSTRYLNTSLAAPAGAVLSGAQRSPDIWRSRRVRLHDPESGARCEPRHPEST